MKEQLEKQVGELRICKDNLFMGNIVDMEELEYWEARLDKMQEPYAITFCLKKGVIKYNLYCNSKRKGGAFKWG